MTSTSCNAIAQELLEGCLGGHPPEAIPPALVEEPCGRALFGILVEGLADRFEPALCDAYARLFAGALARIVPGLDPISLVARYQRIRRPRRATGEPRRVYVLSRITLGADVAVTSVLAAAAKQRFPRAEIVFVGPRKNYELFAADGRIRHAPVAYPRGGLADRLSVWNELKTFFPGHDFLVIDPDSRLTQLGLLEVCPEENYHFFESRAYGADTDRPLPELAAAWAAESFGVNGAQPYVALAPLQLSPPKPDEPADHLPGQVGTPLEARPEPGRYIAVSLGVGENQAKRLPDPFEEELLRLLAGLGLLLWIDLGAGGEEAERVRRAVGRSGARASLWDGSFAGFAAIIAGSRLYVGYDSAGQHVAAAAGIPLVSVFAGFSAPRMFDRWRPIGPHATVIRVEQPDPAGTLERMRQALERVV